MEIIKEQIDECTHNCSTCMSGCRDGEGKLEKALDEISSWDEKKLLEALNEIC